MTKITYEEALEIDEELQKIAGRSSRSAYEPTTRRALLPTPLEPAPEGYVAYLVPGAPSNKAHYHAGVGRTPTEALQASRYWVNQFDYVRVVPRAEAPEWAIESAEASDGRPKTPEERQAEEKEAKEWAELAREAREAMRGKGS